MGTQSQCYQCEHPVPRQTVHKSDLGSCRLFNMKITLVLCLVLAVAAAKFCPGEKNGNQCRAGDGAYKCSVFFENLTPRRKLTWIGALPDALKKAKNKEEAKEILGADVTEESFNNFPGCQESAANARCYTTVSQVLQSEKGFHFCILAQQAEKCPSRLL